MQLINGKVLAREREQLLKKRIDRFVQKSGRSPTLVAVELSDDEGSRLYLKLKKAAAERVGIEFQATSDKRQVTSKIADGIFIQHPPSYDKKKWQHLVDQIPPEKDVDCLTTTNLQLIKEGKPRFLPATVKAVGYCLISALNLKRSDLSVLKGRTLRDKRIAILGRSPIVGLPLSWWLSNLGGDITLLHSGTSRLALRASCLTADILISTVGKPGFVTGDMVKNGVIIIDCGSPRADVAFSEVAPKSFAITPVPGGVGPLTVVSLMENVIQSSYLADRARS